MSEHVYVILGKNSLNQKENETNTRTAFTRHQKEFLYRNLDQVQLPE